jgi:hypothetical protein
MINKIKKDLKDDWLLSYYVKVHNQKESFRLQTYLFENGFQWPSDDNPDIDILKSIDYYILHAVSEKFMIQYSLGEVEEKFLSPGNNIFIDFSDLFSYKKFLNNLFDKIKL